MIIIGHRGLANTSDIYLQHLVKELKQLWVNVETYDASLRRNVFLWATLLWTINDFPAYANLSSWSMKGKYTSPSCNAQTSSKLLSDGKKFCYLAY